MKTTITNKKNNLTKLTKVLGIGALMSFGLEANSQCIANYTYANDSVNTGNVIFASASSGATTYSWDFGDSATSLLANPNHLFSNAGTYQVCLTISDSSGNTCTHCDTVVVGNPNGSGCQAFFYTYTDTINSNSIYFSNASQGNSTSYSWDFGDGTTSTQSYGNHQYSNSGTYYICLTIADSNGVGCTYCDYVVVENPNGGGCQAFFQPDYDSISVNPTGIHFSNYSAETSTSYSWSFGDSAYSSDQNPYHVFPNAGTYQVCLTVSDSNGSTCTYCDYVSVGSPDSSACNLYVVESNVIPESALNASDGAISITAFGVAPFVFNWSNGATTQDISGLTAGYYDVSVTDNGGCQTWATFEVLNQSDSSNWNYNDSLVTTPVDTCFTFVPDSANIYSYIFSGNDSVIVTWIVYDSTGIIHDFVNDTYTFDSTSTGYYTAVLILNCDSARSVNSSTKFSDHLHIKGLSTAGINSKEIIAENISVYPNPVEDRLNVSFDLSKSDKVIIEILNALGQVIQTEKTNSEYGQKTVIMNISSFAKGLYFVRISSNGQSISRRFVK